MRWLFRFGLIASALGFASAAGAQSDRRAAQIMSGLEPKYHIEGMPRVRHTLAEQMRHYRVPAVSIAVIDNYRIVWTHAAGLRNVASNASATVLTLFQAASMSKAVAAAGLLRLVEDKRLDLGADVNTMLRSWHLRAPDNSPEPVTLRRLLSHTAGINVHGFLGYDRDAALPTLVQVLEGVPPANSEAIRITAVPGSRTEYSGGGTSIAQQVAVDVAGEPFPALMQRTLLGPLGMTNSTFDQPLPEGLWPRAADGYYGDGKPVHGGWYVYPTMAAAGLWTTPTDLAKFIIAIQNAMRGQGKPPIDVPIARLMTTQASQGFGLGPQVQPGYFAHNGANVGFQGTFYGLTEGGRGVVVMTNSDNGLQVAEEVVHSVANAYGWPVLQSQPKNSLALSAATTKGVAGKYSANLAGETDTLEVTAGRSGAAPALFVRSSLARGFPQRLYAEGPLTFFTLSGISLAFSRGEGGRVTTLEVGGTKYQRAP